MNNRSADLNTVDRKSEIVGGQVDYKTGEVLDYQLLADTRDCGRRDGQTPRFGIFWGTAAEQQEPGRLLEYMADSSGFEQYFGSDRAVDCTELKTVPRILADYRPTEYSTTMAMEAFPGSRSSRLRWRHLDGCWIRDLMFPYAALLVVYWYSSSPSDMLRYLDDSADLSQCCCNMFDRLLHRSSASS